MTRKRRRRRAGMACSRGEHYEGSQGIHRARDSTRVFPPVKTLRVWRVSFLAFCFWIVRLSAFPRLHSSGNEERVCLPGAVNRSVACLLGPRRSGVWQGVLLLNTAVISPRACDRSGEGRRAHILPVSILARFAEPIARSRFEVMGVSLHCIPRSAS